MFCQNDTTFEKSTCEISDVIQKIAFAEKKSEALYGKFGKKVGPDNKEQEKIK